MKKYLDDVTIKPVFDDLSDFNIIIEKAIDYVRYNNEISFDEYIDIMSKFNDMRRFYAHYVHLVHGFIFDINSLERSRYGIEFEN